MSSKGLISNIYKQLIQHKKADYKTEELNSQNFSKEDMQMANRHREICSTLLMIRKTQIKTTMRYHVKMTIIKKNTNNKCWRGSRQKRALVHCWQECKLVQPLWKTVYRLLKKLKTELPYDPANPLLGIYLKETKTLIQNDTCTSRFICSTTYTTGKIWKQPKCSLTNEQKLCCMRTPHLF